MLREAFDFLVHVANNAPAGFWPLIVGLCFSALVTQRAKFYVRPELPERTRAFIAQTVAFVTGLGSTWSLWPDRYGFFCGVIVGIASPTLYAIVVRVIGLKWPAVRDLLSEGVR